ncbi:GumC family protein [Pantanalinema rosaneae CENA516]|uniref:GumC family protein n=1 Tax=Pantanalinema rosaneae TaxID=1620701 RepID=UPI003D6DF8C7
MATNQLDIHETEPGYGQLFAVLIRRWPWILGTLASMLAIAAVYTVLKQPTYQSSMQLLIEPNYQGRRDAATPNQQFADANIEIDNSTQITQMRSSQLLQRAVNLLKAEYPELTANQVQSDLLLKQVEEDDVKTKVVQAIYTDHDPIKTQRVLQAIQRVYQDYNREQQKLRLTKGLAFINDQLPVLGNQVLGTEQALEQFRQQQNLIDPELQSQALIDSLKELRYEQQKNRAELQAAQARYQSLQQQLDRSPQRALTAARLSQAPRYQALLNELQKIDLALAQQRVRFTDDSPVIQKLLEQREEQQALLANETQRVLGNSPAAAQAPTDILVKDAQMGEAEVTLVSQLAEARNTWAALRSRGESLDQSVRSLEADLQRFPTLLAQYGRLQPGVQLSRATLEQLLKARQELALEIARGGFDWQIVEEPKLGKHIGPHLKQNLLLGAVAGLMLGCVIAFVRDGMDDAVHSPDDLKNLSELPLLGMIPELPYAKNKRALPADQPLLINSLRDRPAGEMVTSLEQIMPWVLFRESLDLVYKNIQLLSASTNLRSLVVTSALAGEGKSTIALGLAMSAARLHQRVLLIDADLRRPSLHKQLDLPNDQGLSTLLAGETTMPNKRSIQVSSLYTDIPISVLTSGPPPSDPVQLLSSQRMSELMTFFEQSYDLVVVDAPPVLGIVDAMLAASFCDGAVLVERIGQVKRTDLTQATAMLNKHRVIGVVANGATTTTKPYLAHAHNF